MSTPTIHLIVVTGQAQANLIPLLQLKPDYVALAISDDMQDNAKNFVKILKTLGGYQDKHILRYDHVPNVGLEAIKDRALEIEDDLNQRFPESPITYHATGGTKLMALGFYDVFHRAPNRVIYTDTQHHQIEVVYPAKIQPIPIGKILNIESYLLSNDKQHRKHADDDWCTKVKARRELTLWLAQQNETLHRYWSVINSLAHQALAKEQRGMAPRIVEPLQTFKGTLPYKAWQTVLEKCNQAGICGWDAQRPESLYFNNTEGAQYLSGGWLEEYVWLTATELGCDEAWANVEFTELGAPKNDIRNEMDAMILHNNRLLMIECKTSVFKADEALKNVSILYKLDSLDHRTGGLFGDAWLVSARILDDDTLKRAQEYKIKVLHGIELKQFRSHLQRWMTGEK